MKTMDLYSHNHQKGMWEYHLEWCPRYRYEIFANEKVRMDCEQALRDAAQVKQLSVLELAVMPDHAHMIARSKKPMNVSEVLFYLKGKSSYELFKKNPSLRQRYWRNHLWSRGSFSRTAGLDIERARDYVKNQEDIHQRKLTEFN